MVLCLGAVSHVDHTSFQLGDNQRVVVGDGEDALLLGLGFFSSLNPKTLRSRAPSPIIEGVRTYLGFGYIITNKDPIYSIFYLHIGGL